MNFFNQGIPLGRWFGIRVVIHWTFLVYAAFELMGSKEVGMDALLIGILFAVVLVHEFGHALSCLAVGGDAEHIVLWPLGGIAFVQPPPKAWAWLVTTVCGPLVNAILWPVFYVLSKQLLERHYGTGVWDQIDHLVGTGAFVLDPNFTMPELLCAMMWQINRLLLLFNLIPGFPMDGGRLLQELLWFVVGYGKSMQVAGMVGTVCGLGFVILGSGLRAIKLPLLGQLGGRPDMILLIIGILVMMQSFGIYKQSQQIKGWRKN